MLFTVMLLLLMIFFEEFLIRNSGHFMIFEESFTKSVGPVPFSAECLICRHVQTDGQIDRWPGKLIQVGLAG
jgi:hypothetical protein